MEEIKVIDIDNALLSRALNSFGGLNLKAILRLAANSFIIRIPIALFPDNKSVFF